MNKEEYELTDEEYFECDSDSISDEEYDNEEYDNEDFEYDQYVENKLIEEYSKNLEKFD